VEHDCSKVFVLAGCIPQEVLYTPAHRGGGGGAGGTCPPCGGPGASGPLAGARGKRP